MLGVAERLWRYGGCGSGHMLLRASFVFMPACALDLHLRLGKIILVGLMLDVAHYLQVPPVASMG